MVGGTAARVAFAAAVAANLVVLYWPRPVSAGGVPYLDKAVHVAIFGAVAVTGVLAGVPVVWLAGLLALHAVGSELVQHFLLPDRSGDPFDAVADLVGTALGLLLGVRLTGRHRGVAAGEAGGSWVP